jgi:hypothetical protein
MLRHSTPFTWHFTADDRLGLLIRYSYVDGTYDLCRRSQVGALCWETRTLSRHETLEQAITAADQHALVPKR